MSSHGFGKIEIRTEYGMMGAAETGVVRREPVCRADEREREVVRQRVHRGYHDAHRGAHRDRKSGRDHHIQERQGRHGYKNQGPDLPNYTSSNS